MSIQHQQVSLFEENKLDELFSMTYSFDPLKTLLKALMDRFNGQQMQISSLKEIGDRL
jgi:hypothetical protein